jgi:hypothetical protein
MKLEMVHSFDVSRALYESRINCPEILEMCQGRLPYLKSRHLVESKEGPGPDKHSWRFRCEADYKLPEAAKKVIGDRIGWFEESVFDRKEHMVRFKVLPDFFKGRYRCEGEQLFVETGAETFDRVMTVELDVGILLVGRLVEKHILERLKETYAVEYEMQKEFYRKVRAAQV